MPLPTDYALLKLIMNKLTRYDLISLALLFVIFIFSLARIPYLPQYVDGYYHLSVANAFIKSGGWVNWAWWDFAPLGRPHLYPPLYHILLSGLIKSGASGLFALQLTESMAVPLFFTIFWFVMRQLGGFRIAFFSLVPLSGYFPFFTSVSGNVPATIALIMGFLSWLFFYRKQFISSIIFLTLAFYTHAGIPWMFIFSYLFILIFSDHRRDVLWVIVVSLLLAAPFLAHEFVNRYAVSLKALGEQNFTRFSVLVLLGSVIGLIVSIRKMPLLSCLSLGLVVGAYLVFNKYPYRFFSAQGMVGVMILASLFWDKLFTFLKGKERWLMLFLFFIIFAAFHPVVEREYDKLSLNSSGGTYLRLLTGDVDDFMYSSMYVPQVYTPTVEAIKKFSDEDDIIISNMRIAGQIFAALSNRANGYSMLGEVSGGDSGPDYAQAKLIIWAKDNISTKINHVSVSWLKEVIQDDMDYVFMNTNNPAKIKIVPAKIGFGVIYFFLAVAFIIIFWEISFFKRSVV